MLQHFNYLEIFLLYVIKNLLSFVNSSQIFLNVTLITKERCTLIFLNRKNYNWKQINEN